MATLTQMYKPYSLRLTILKKCDEAIEKLIPRPCIVVSLGFILAGLSIPLLMAVKFLSVTFLLGFVGFILVATGGVLALISCGEI